MKCDECKEDIPPGKEAYGYGKVVCSDECFQTAGQSYKPNMESNRGGGVGKNRIII